jgi:hypothetical protein
MLSTKITTTGGNILSQRFIPETTRPLLEKRTENNKKFGRLEITTPLIDRHDDGDDDGGETKLQPHNLIAGFVLDTSGSMQGKKIQNAVNTIRNFVDVIHAERNGKTIQRQPIRAWIYLITFNDNANLEIPFQEITDQTIPEINRRLDRIRPDGSTSFEEAFKKQTRVLDEIMIQLDSEAAASAAASAAAAGDEKEPPHYHLIRFFETDGEITKGTTDVKLLYKMMRQFTPPANIRVTSEDYTIGYGSDVDLRSLKELSGPYEPITDDDDASAHNTSTSAHNASTSAPETAVGGRNPPSTLVTILKPADIGLQIGDILFKLIMRYGTHVVVSVSSEQGNVEIFEYQKHVWSSSTTLHSLFHGERKQLWIQYTPTTASATASAASATATAVNVKIQYENQFTGKQYTYKFVHEIHNDDAAVVPPSPPSPLSIEPESTIVFQQTYNLILGMVQIEILKMFREAEADRYDKNTIVREAYKAKRMLNEIDAHSRLSFPNIAAFTANLMTDVKVIIGSTTIMDNRQEKMLLHARRICSAEQDVFSTGADVSKKYVEFEEDYEEEAKRVMEEAKRDHQDQDQDQDQNPDADAADAAEETQDDVFHSRIPTQLPPHYHNRHHYGRGRHSIKQSEVRTLCVKIAIARNNKEDTTAKELYAQMRRNQGHYYGGNGGDDDEHHHHHRLTDEDTFSTPMADDVYRQRRVGMMRQMSSS